MTTVDLVRAQGYREGYSRALADVLAQFGEALGCAHEAHCRAHPQSQRIEALMHASAIVRGLRERARRRAEVRHG